MTDIAKYRNDNDPRFVIQNWMRNRNTVEFLAVWEELHNPDFNRVQFEAVRSEAGLNRFVMTPTKWIEQTNAIGIVSKAGRYGGGTYAHSDIAMAFATWISPEFQLYIMKDYRRLKQDENSRLSLDWNLNRALSKVNYRIHTDAVKENLIPPELTPEQIAYTYASEADLLNVAPYGYSLINQQIKRNIERFQNDMMFQLSDNEVEYLRSQFVTANISSKSRSNPYVFTEQGVYMLMTVLKGELAVRTLVHLKNSPTGVNITIFSDNVGNNKLHNIEFTDFCKEYPSVKISMKKTGGIFHDRFIVLDYGTADERVFLCGASSKDAGARITSIVEDYGISKYAPVIATLLKNPTLILPH